MKRRNNQKGFTLVELMIVIAIVGILAAVAMPMYSDYTKKANFMEVVGMTAAVKKAVAICYMTVDETGAACLGGSNGVPADFGPVGNLATLVTGANGVITATGIAVVDSRTYILTPTFTAGIGVSWAKGGDCVVNNLC